MLHFCGLGYSRTNGQTCDNFIDFEKLKFEPEFQRYMADAFAPVGLSIDEWRAELPAGKELDVPVVVINDLYRTGKARCSSAFCAARRCSGRPSALRSDSLGQTGRISTAWFRMSRATTSSKRRCWAAV